MYYSYSVLQREDLKIFKKLRKEPKNFEIYSKNISVLFFCAEEKLSMFTVCLSPEPPLPLLFSQESGYIYISLVAPESNKSLKESFPICQ